MTHLCQSHVFYQLQTDSQTRIIKKEKKIDEINGNGNLDLSDGKMDKNQNSKKELPADLDHETNHF